MAVFCERLALPGFVKGVDVGPNSDFTPKLVPFKSASCCLSVLVRLVVLSKRFSDAWAGRATKVRAESIPARLPSAMEGHMW
jgi:hypothetical protein